MREARIQGEVTAQDLVQHLDSFKRWQQGIKDELMVGCDSATGFEHIFKLPCRDRRQTVV
ncbi:hypothetical protein HAALTHF_39670n [Vreelandella aquamarina]|nr:hypothetical protein HAALTHF_39670n [Halomonas axialensis]